MPEFTPRAGSLALYKIRPALVTAVSDKIEIQLEGGKSKRVRPKDIQVLHPGPLGSLGELDDPEGDVNEAWELLTDSETELTELAELVFGEFTPATAWAAWKLLDEGLYFEGTPGHIVARSGEAIAADRTAREAKQRAEAEWQALLERLRGKRMESGDRERLREVERLALGESEQSRILQALGHQESPVNAHRLLSAIGYWAPTHNPYPGRQGLPEADPGLALPTLPQEERLDLTHLPAYAIDDEGSEDPDDAISLDGERIWVHVADVAALVDPDSELDREARARGANLYLPEGIVHMLPPEATAILGLGLQAHSPALSIGIDLDQSGEIANLEIALTRIAATRHSYAEIDRRMEQEPFASLLRLTGRFRQRRLAAGASTLALPEVNIRVVEGRVQIRPLAASQSREMVTDAMLMAGEAVARYTLEREIPIPFATQPPPDQPQQPEGMAAMYSYRRQLKPSRLKTLEEPHAGLGLARYTRATSPLRRYSDLLVHQQLRAHLLGRESIPLAQISERMGVAEMVAVSVRKTERLSNNHWKLVYLMQQPGWHGEAVVVEMVERRATLLIPELALETKMRLPKELPLDSKIGLAVREVDLPDLVARFRSEG